MYRAPLNPSIDALVQAFAYHTVAQDEAKDAETGNAHAEKHISAFHQLVELYGDAGRDALSVLLDDSDPRIRCRAAVWLLRHKHQQAMSVLNELAAGSGFVAFCAQQSIKNWHNGDWQLDQ